MNIRQFGDFQTPLELVRAILKTPHLKEKRWERILEPTCGRGNFIRGIIESDINPKEIVGIEIQDSYIEEAQKIKTPKGAKINIVKGDIFKINLSKDIKWHSNGPLLVIGNPPWVTNADVGAMGGTNLPQKTNLRKLRGIDAITGQSNFDIAEYIWIKLISDLYSQDATIALLCKASVARSILEYVNKFNPMIFDAEIRIINAKEWFGASVDACLFYLKMGKNGPANYDVRVYESLESTKPQKMIGFIDGHLISDMETYRSVSFIEGSTSLEWRQGIKHDAASVMELVMKNGSWHNAADEKVDIEDEFVYPLIKGSDVRTSGKSTIFNRSVVVPQKEIGGDTRFLEIAAPRLWNYLTMHQDVFKSRKSSIYKSKPPFSIFGVGKYSFSKYKVLVSGLHKQPHFIAVGPINGKPVFCDDTCYLLPCDSAVQAAVIAAILNHPLSLKFINSISFTNSKRPITKSILMRINISALANKIKFNDVKSEIERNLEILKPIEGHRHQLPSDLIDAIRLEGNQPIQETLFGGHLNSELRGKHKHVGKLG